MTTLAACWLASPYRSSHTTNPPPLLSSLVSDIFSPRTPVARAQNTHFPPLIPVSRTVWSDDPSEAVVTAVRCFLGPCAQPASTYKLRRFRLRLPP